MTISDFLRHHLDFGWYSGRSLGMMTSKVSFIVLLFLLFTYVHSVDYYWRNPTTGLWSDLRNWVIGSQDSDTQPTTLPTTGDNVYIIKYGNYDVIYDVGIDQTPVYEKIVIGSGESRMMLADMQRQSLVLKNPLSVNSVIEIRSSGALNILEEQSVVKGGAKLICGGEGVVNQSNGAVEIIGDIEVAGLYLHQGGVISGSVDSQLWIKKEGTLRTFGNSSTMAIQRKVKINGVLDHSATGSFMVTKDMSVENDGAVVINASGFLFATNAYIRGTVVVNTIGNLRGSYEILGRVNVQKDINIHDSLILRDNGKIYLDYSSLICWKSCKIFGVIEGATQTQSNKLLLKNNCVLELEPPSKVSGNLNIHIEDPSYLISKSDGVDFTGDVDNYGTLTLMTGKLKASSINVFKKLWTKTLLEYPREGDVHIYGDVRIHGEFVHESSTKIHLHNAMIVFQNATLLWNGSGDIIGEGALHNQGKILIRSSSTLAVDRVKNEGTIQLSSSKFTFKSSEFLQGNPIASIIVSGTRLIFDAKTRLNEGSFIAVDDTESFLVVSEHGEVDSNIPLSGKVSLAVYGTFNLFKEISITRNIDVFPKGVINISKGSILGEGQLIVHQNGKVVLNQGDNVIIEKFGLVAGDMDLRGSLIMNNDFTILEGSGVLRVLESGTISGKGQISNHGEFVIDTLVPASIGVDVSNAGRLRVKSKTEFLKNLVQVDSQAQTILHNAVLTTKEDFVVADGYLKGIGTIISKTVSVAGRYEPFLDDQVGRLRIEGLFHASGSSAGFLKVKSQKEFSQVDARDGIEIDGAKVHVDIMGNVDLKGNPIPIFQGKKVKGKFGIVEVTGTNDQTDLKYQNDEGKILLQLKGQPNSARSSYSFSIASFTALLSLAIYLLL